MKNLKEVAEYVRSLRKDFDGHYPYLGGVNDAIKYIATQLDKLHNNNIELIKTKMIEVETKHELDAEVYFIIDNEITKGTVQKIRLVKHKPPFTDQYEVIVEYEIGYWAKSNTKTMPGCVQFGCPVTSVWLSESILHTSPEGILLDYYKNNQINNNNPLIIKDNEGSN